MSAAIHVRGNATLSKAIPTVGGEGPYERLRKAQLLAEIHTAVCIIVPTVSERIGT